MYIEQDNNRIVDSRLQTQAKYPCGHARFFARFLIHCTNYHSGHVYLPLLIMFAFNPQCFQSRQISLSVFWHQLTGREKSKHCQFKMITNKVHATFHKSKLRI